MLILQPEEGTSHICVFTPKELVKLQLGLLVITYIAQFVLMNTKVGLSAPLHNTNLLNLIYIIQGITDSPLTPLVFNQESLSLSSVDYILSLSSYKTASHILFELNTSFKGKHGIPSAVLLSRYW